jgi:tetratricopeptide (TPR) repeat protein
MPMNSDVVNLLRMTTVRVLDQAGDVKGTGFFITKDRVLTAAHVVEQFGGARVFVQWDGQGRAPAECEWAKPQNRPVGVAVYPLPDLAVLRVPDAASVDHPCGMLGEQITGEDMLAYGYTQGATVPEATHDPVKVEYEGNRSEMGWELIKCKDSKVDPGMSGAPLLDLTSGYIVGVVKAQRSPSYPAGLYAISVTALRDLLPDLWADSQLIHQSDRRWRRAIQPGATVADPRGAARNILTAALKTVGRRTWNLPRGGDRASLHQTVWVRQIGWFDTKPVAAERDLELAAERRRWRPLREIGKITVVRGMPGYGKSWLLAYHAETIAASSLAALDERMDAERLKLPLLLDCADLAGRLTADPDENEVAAALAKASLLTIPLAAADDSQIMAREAYEAGNLVICLDGLDEVPGRFKNKLQRALAIIAAGPNRLLIATRHTALRLLDDVTAEGRVDVEVLGFTRGEASRFIAAWLARNPEGRGALDRALESSDALREIAEVPLLLSFLCRLADMPGRSEPFPTSKSRLYQEVVDGLLSGGWRGRHAADDDSPALPRPRLQALADSLGALLDSWRSSGERISRAELSAQLSQHPNYEQLRATAVARWHAWQLASDADPTEPPADPVLWEFLFDGLLVTEGSCSAEPTLRVLHPSLRDFLLASYLAHMDRDGWLTSLDKHRWFDADWQEIFALASSLMPDPDVLIRLIIDVEADPWLTQASFAAQCVAESGTKVSDATADVVVRALMDGAEITHLSDRQRRHGSFARLVRAQVRPAVSRALAICGRGIAGQPDLYLEAVAALAEAGHEHGLRLAGEVLQSTQVPRHYRERLIKALTLSEDDAALALVEGHLTTRGLLGDLDAFLVVLKPESQTLLRTARRLLRTRDWQYSPRVAVAASLLGCGDDAVGQVLEAAHDRTLEWGLRCQLFQLLINADVPGASREAMLLLHNPAVRPLDRSYVIEAMIRDGESSALDNAAELLQDVLLPWQRRAALAAAVADIGTAGVELLRAQLHSGLPLHLTVHHLDALVDIRDKAGLDFAKTVSRDEGVPAWLRGTVILALLRVEPGLVSMEAAMQLVGDPRLTGTDRFDLSIALARAGIRDASDAVRAALDGDVSGVNWPQTSRQLAASGPVGRSTLARIAADGTYSWEIRTGSVLALAGAQHPADLENALAGIPPDEIPELWRNRLLFGLTAAGQPQFVEDLVRFIPSVAGAYEVFYQFMHGPNASRELFFGNLGALRPAMSAAPAGETIGIDDELLAACDLTWNSAAERASMLSWFSREMEKRTTSRLRGLMLPRQIEEVNETDEESMLDWLSINLPEFGGFVRDEFERLKDDVKAGRIGPPRGIPADLAGQPALTNLGIALAPLSDVLDLGRTGHWQSLFRLLEANRSVLLTDVAEGLLWLAIRLGADWGLHEAHLFVLRTARTHGIGATWDLASNEELLTDRLDELLDQAQFQELHLGGAFGVLRFAESAACYLYAAVGAEGMTGHSLAVEAIRFAGYYANDEQTSQFQARIRELAERFRWEPAPAQELVDMLNHGHAEARDDPAATYYSRGRALERQGRHAEALAAYDKALELQPDQLDIHQDRAVALGQLGRFDEARAALEKALQLRPDQAEIHRNRGVALRELGRLEEALAEYDEALRLQPDQPSFWYSRGIALNQLGRFDEALAAYDRALELRADQPDVHQNRGVTLEQLGRLDEALAAWDQALRLQPDNPYRHQIRGVMLERLGRVADALAAYEQAVRLQPDQHEFHRNRVAALQRLGRLGEALAAVDEALRLQRDQPDIHHSRGAVLAELGRLEEALAEYDEALRLQRDQPDVHYSRGVALGQLGRFDEALAAYDRALELQPDQPDIQYARAVALGQLDRFDEALAAYDRALELQPDQPNLHVGRSAMLERLGRFDEALAAAEETLRLQPDHKGARVGRAFSLSRLGRHEEALAAYDRALELQPDQPDIHHNRGVTLERLGRFDGALAAWDQALRLQPDDQGARVGRAFSLSELGRHEEALAAYDRALELQPDQPDIHHNRGVTLERLGRFDEALAAWDQALRLQHDYMDARHGRALALTRLGRFDEALAAYDELLAIDPGYANAHNVRAIALGALGRHTESLASCDLALAADPDNVSAHENRGIILAVLGDLDEALAEFRTADLLAPTGAGEGRAWAAAILWHRHAAVEARELFARVQGHVIGCTPFLTAELEALAMCALGQPDGAARRLRDALPLRVPTDRAGFLTIYDLLSDPPLPGVNELRAIVTAEG